MPLSPEDWTFLGEGNMHVVLSYRPRDARNECAAWRGKVIIKRARQAC